jgi:acetoacetyl-CoA synthetase
VVVDRFSEIEDCIIVGQRRKSDTDERIAMFVKMRTGKLTESLQRSIRAAVQNSLTARHVPALIAQVADIPYTVNGKKIENVVRDIVSGKVPVVSGTVTNPKSLAEYPRFAQEDSLIHWAKI